MTVNKLHCWKCGEELADVLLPFPRLAKCRSCRSDLHVCYMCEYYDTTVSNSCREPIAEKINDKSRTNFCGYFQARDVKREQDDSIVDSNKSSLENLFGLEQGKSNLSSTDADKAKQELDALFGLDDRKRD